MLTRLVGDFQAAQHASDLLDACAVVQCDELRASGFAIGQFADAKLVMALRGHLRQVRDTQHLAAIAQGTAELRGIYVMGKAATLNGRVGDVMLSKVVHDEHSDNTYLIRNGLHADDVWPFMRHGTVLDNQKALTVRSAFLQNRSYMDVFYREGYTVMEMEAGPYLSAIYETTSPQRHPKGEIVNLTELTHGEVGLIHYASDTPYSRRQSLLSKSMSYFGMESTYGCALAIARRIFARELGQA